MKEKNFSELMSTIKKGEIWESDYIRIMYTPTNGNITIEDMDGTKRDIFTICSGFKFKFKGLLCYKDECLFNNDCICGFPRSLDLVNPDKKEKCKYKIVLEEQDE